MQFITAIAASKESPEDVIVVAATWFRNVEPEFYTKNMSLQSMHRDLSALVVIHGEELVPAINAACNRTIEKLLLKKSIIPNNPPEIALLVPAKLENNIYVLPHSNPGKHWLLNAAKNGLNAWLAGERPI